MARKRFFAPSAQLLALSLIVFSLAGCARMPRHHLVPPPPPAAAPAGFYHVVSRGETLYRIAKNYHVDVNRLMLANGIRTPGQLAAGQKIYIPGVEAVAPAYAPRGGGMSIEDVRRLLGPAHATVWKTITVHHSGTEVGGAESFNRDHLRRHMGGLFYHFVIGNGSRTGDGQIEVGWRWKRQVRSNRPNDINICLVGNFDKQQVSDAQFNSLVSLITVLREDYHVSLANVRRHRDIKGRHTECPGNHFPFQRLIAALSQQPLAQ